MINLVSFKMILIRIGQNFGILVQTGQSFAHDGAYLSWEIKFMDEGFFPNLKITQEELIVLISFFPVDAKQWLSFQPFCIKY